MKRKRHPSEQHRAPSLTSVIYPRKRLEGKPPSLPKSFSCLLHRRILQGKDRQHATLGAEITRIAERAERAQTSGRIFRPDAACSADAGPAADAGKHGHILLAIRTVVRHRVTDDA